MFSSKPFLLLFSLLVTSLHAESCGNVSNGCGSHGTCQSNTQLCTCNSGYGGVDCTMRQELCLGDVGPTGVNTCFHGGVCQQSNADASATEEQWICDCSNAKKGGKVYAGHQCEFPAQVSCEKGKTESTHAFCTNGGTCRSQVEAGQHHPMCLCPDGFEGRHCQYATGTAPDQEVVYAIPSPIKSQGISGGGIAVLVILSLLVTCMAAAFCMRPKGRYAAKTSSIDMPMPPDDLEMKAAHDDNDDNIESDNSPNEIL